MGPARFHCAILLALQSYENSRPRIVVLLRQCSVNFAGSLSLTCEVTVSMPSPIEILEKKLTGGSFDLPTSWLWAQHASTAPSCWPQGSMKTVDLVLWFF